VTVNVKLESRGDVEKVAIVNALRENSVVCKLRDRQRMPPLRIDGLSGGAYITSNNVLQGYSVNLSLAHDMSGLISK
jgi:hypothetical protein